MKTLQADLEEPEEDVTMLYQIRSQPGQPLKVEVTLDGKPQWMDHIQKRFISSESEAPEESPEQTDDVHFPSGRGHTNQTTSPEEITKDGPTGQQQQSMNNATTTSQTAESEQSGQRRHYPARVQRPPDRLTY